jgi:heat shock protein HtpX
LEKIGQENMPMQRASQATAHLFLANPLSGRAFSKLFATHPPIAERVAKLRSMESKV